MHWKRQVVSAFLRLSSKCARLSRLPMVATTHECGARTEHVFPEEVWRGQGTACRTSMSFFENRSRLLLPNVCMDAVNSCQCRRRTSSASQCRCCSSSRQRVRPTRRWQCRCPTASSTRRTTPRLTRKWLSCLLLCLCAPSSAAARTYAVYISPLLSHFPVWRARFSPSHRLYGCTVVCSFLTLPTRYREVSSCPHPWMWGQNPARVSRRGSARPTACRTSI